VVNNPIESDSDPLHPRTEPGEVFAQENFFEDLRIELERAEAVLNPKLKLKASENVQLFQLKKVYQLLQHLFAEPEVQNKEGSSLANLLEYCWQPGEGGFATSTSETAFMRFAVASWVYRQPWFHETSQRLFGVGLKEDTSIRCPHCVERNKSLRVAGEQNLAHHAGAVMMGKFLESLICDPTFVRGEMKKQSINRIVVEFRDKFGVRNEHMRNQSAREKFRRLADVKKARASLVDYQI
jgi:hypothetical protein